MQDRLSFICIPCSRFIQSLVEVFSNHAHDKELIDLLRMTSERLSQFTNDRNEKQTCNIELRHLNKVNRNSPIPVLLGILTCGPKASNF